MKNKLLALVALLASLPCFAAEIQPPPSLAPVLAAAMPAVVNISVQGEISKGPVPKAQQRNPESNQDKNNDKDDDNAQPGSEPQGPRGPSDKFQSLGSGVVIDAKQGYVITNAHVVNNASTITVTLNDGRRLEARLLGADPGTDIAVLKIEARRLTALPISDSNKLHVGDFVVAIGNPFGLNASGSSQTATFGIISALQRSELRLDGVENFIQTDAAINPGNSGGALINTKGELIGINTAILTPLGGNIGIGFAIPVNMMRDVAQQLIQYGSITRGLMGIYVQHLTPELATAFKLPETTQGALVTQVNPGSPAASAGIKTGDVIQEVNGRTVTDASQVKTTIGLLRVGSKVNMKILRNGKPQQINAVVEDIKQHMTKLQKSNPFLFGLALTSFNEEVPTHGRVKGVQIVGASEDSPGWRAGLRPGDVIIQANNTTTADLDQLQQVASTGDKQLLLHVLHGTGALYLVVK